MRRKDLLFEAGGETVERFGTIVRKLSREADNGYTHTRADTGTYHSANGLVLTAASGVPRVHYLDGAAYLRLEKASGNQLLRSEAFDNAAWTTSAATRTANATTAPDGATTADDIVATSAAATHSVSQALTGRTADARYAFSCYGKIGDYGYIGLRFDETAATANRVEAAWSLTDGTLEASGANGTGSLDATYSESLGDGWYRFTVVGQVLNSATAISARVYVINAAATLPAASSFTGDDTSGIYVWGAQFEDGQRASTSYIPTTTVAVTRAADTFYADFLQPPQAMTVYAKFIERGTGDVSLGGVLHIGSEGVGTDPRLQLLSGTASSTYLVRHDAGTGIQQSLAAAAVDLGDTVELRAILNTDGSVQLGQSINAAAEVVAAASSTEPLGVAWAGTRIYINSRGSSSPGAALFRSIKIARGVRSMTDMRSL